MTTTDPRPPQHATASATQHAERAQRETAALDRALRELIATHHLPAPATISHDVRPDGSRSLVLVAGDADVWDTWCPLIDSTGVVSPGPYRCGTETIRVRVGQLVGVTTVLVVDDALQALRRRPSDVTVDAERDPETFAAVTS